MQDTKTVYGSTETFPWGGSETTYYVNGQVIGFSGSHSDAGAAGGYSSSNETYFDKDHKRVGDSYDDGQGNSGSNFRVKLTAAVDIDGDGTDDFGAGTAVLSTFRRQVQAVGLIKMKMVRLYLRQVNIRITMVLAQAILMSQTIAICLVAVMFMTALRLWGANWTRLGQKSSIDLAEAAKDANSGISKVTDFTGLPASFKAASGDTYVRVESFGDAAMGQQGSESTYMDASGKVLGYANSNSYSYDDGSGKTVTNTSVNYDSADREHPLGGTQIDGHSIRSSIIEVIDNSDNSNDVDLTPADTGNAKEITFKGSIVLRQRQRLYSRLMV